VAFDGANFYFRGQPLMADPIILSTSTVDPDDPGALRQAYLRDLEGLQRKLYAVQAEYATEINSLRAELDAMRGQRDALLVQRDAIRAVCEAASVRLSIGQGPR
jgi:hypothetical protein